MRDRFPNVLALAGSLFVAAGFVAWLLWWGGHGLGPPGAKPNQAQAAADEARASPDASLPGDAAVESQRLSAATTLKTLLQDRLGGDDTRSNEAVITFKTGEAYRRYLARTGLAGLRVIGRIDALWTVRVGYDSLDGLGADMTGNAAEYSGVDANHLVYLPNTPAAENRPVVSQVAVGNRALALLGVIGDHSQWGRGVIIAVLDTGVAQEATLAGGRVRYLDIGLGAFPGTGAEDGHGTAVAGLAAGASSDAPGVAPAATVLSIRVTDGNGTSDSFTLAQGIVAAVDAGARIVNISMGSYSATSVLANAIAYAGAQGAVIVASAGNDGAAQLTWPAADPRVVSVGAVDALEQQVYFSNAGTQLQITAPGYGVEAVWPGGRRVSFDGTSASAPLVAGALAAVISTSPGLTAAQAWTVLRQYAGDGGAPGADPDYGNGILNLGWAMDRDDPIRVDTALAGQYYDAAAGTMNVVVQNRGARAVGGLQLAVSVSGVAANHAIPVLNPGATTVVRTPVTAAQLAATGGLVFRTQLSNPAGLVDRFPGNNAKSGVIVPLASP